MSGDGPPQAIPRLGELLDTLTWEQLRPIAERHGIPVVGRRREPLLARLEAALLDAAHLDATVGVLESGARSLLGMLVLRGGSGRTADIESWRQCLRAARPDLDPALATLRPAQDSAILAGLGLCFRRPDGTRRGAYQLVVPAELVDRLPRLLPAARSAGAGTPPQTFSRVYADLSRLLAVLATSRSEGADGQRRGSTPDDDMRALATAAEIDPAAAALWLEVLKQVGLLAGPAARPVVEQEQVVDFVAPDTFVHRLRDAWLALDSPAELSLARAQTWRVVQRLGAGRWEVGSLAATLEALDLLPPLPAGPDTAAGSPAAGDRLFGRVLAEMRALGLVERDDDTLQLAAAFVPDTQPVEPRVILATDSLTAVNPDRLPPAVFRTLAGLGVAELAPDGALRWEVDAAAIARLVKNGGDVAQLLQALEAYTPVPDEFARSLEQWEAATAVVELHYPLPVLLARDAATLEHILRAAGLPGASTPLGDRAVVVAPAEADAVFERLQKRGFWPRRGHNEPSGR